PAPGECHRQFRQGGAARAGQDRVRRRSGRLSRPRHVGGADRQGALSMADAAEGRHDDLSRSAAGDRNPWLVAVVISIATFMQVLDTSIANVALRNIAGSLAAGIDESTWIITSY